MSSPRHKSRSSQRRAPLGARAVALNALAAVEGKAMRSPDALSQALNKARVADPRERALATELTYGVLRWRARLDHAIAPWVRQGFPKLEPLAQDALRLGAYQILMLERIPGPIAVSATQDALRQLRLARLTGLVNGVLRRVVEHEHILPEGDSLDALSVATSLPVWILAQLETRFGAEHLRDEALGLKTRAETTVRPTLHRGGFEAMATSLALDGFVAEPTAYGAACVSGPGDPFASKAFKTGLFTPQDPASLAVVELMDVKPQETVLDLCAGRGVKATALADRGAKVLAVDIEGRKLKAALGLARRLGVDGALTARTADAADPSVALGQFDHVLVDAPCTGLGTLRKHPEIAWRRRPEDVRRLSELQHALITSGARHVRSGGSLVYAVCTFTNGESSVPTLPGFILEEPVLSTRPSEGYDSFFACRWRRE